MKVATYATWDYSEKLVLDRESETLEHIQNIGSGCVVSRKYYVQDGVLECNSPSKQVVL